MIKDCITVPNKQKSSTCSWPAARLCSQGVQHLLFPKQPSQPFITLTFITEAEEKVIGLIIKAALVSTTTTNCPFIWCYKQAILIDVELECVTHFTCLATVSQRYTEQRERKNVKSVFVSNCTKYQDSPSVSIITHLSQNW